MAVCIIHHRPAPGVSLSGVAEGQHLPFPATLCQLVPAKNGTRGGDDSTEGSPCPSSPFQLMFQGAVW